MLTVKNDFYSEETGATKHIQIKHPTLHTSKRRGGTFHPLLAANIESEAEATASFKCQYL